jgi:hypothetical protein
VLEAAKDARKQTLQIAAAEMEAAVEDLEIEDGRVVVRGVPDKGVTLASIGKKGNLYMSKVPPVLGVSHPAFAVQAPAFAAELAKIEVDPDTGQTTIHDFVVVQDAGKAINPLGVEGQMQGGAVQSIGIALTEAMMYDKNGRLMNPSLLDYRKPLRPICPTSRRSSSRFRPSSCGVGEPPIVPAPAVLANAVHDATGVRLTGPCRPSESHWPSPPDDPPQRGRAPSDASYPRRGLTASAPPGCFCHRSEPCRDRQRGQTSDMLCKQIYSRCWHRRQGGRWAEEPMSLKPSLEVPAVAGAVEREAPASRRSSIHLRRSRRGRRAPRDPTGRHESGRHHANAGRRRRAGRRLSLLRARHHSRRRSRRHLSLPHVRQ